MNNQANILKLERTKFSNPHGKFYKIYNKLLKKKIRINEF